MTSSDDSLGFPRLDTVRRFRTPEGVDLELRVAGPAVRAGAFVVDSLIRYGLLLVVMTPLGLIGDFGFGLFLLLFFAAEWFYPVVFELNGGATPGKRLFGISVVNDDGTPVTWLASITRNLLRTADFFPGTYGAGLVCMLMNEDFKRLGDLAGGTLVIYAEMPRDYSHVRTLAPRAPPQPLGSEEQVAIIDLAERLDQLSPDRAIELAEILVPWHQRRGQGAVDEVEAYANWVFRGGV